MNYITLIRQGAETCLMARKNHSKMTGILIGGSGLIGGAITHYFKTKVGPEIELLSPNSKKLSLRVVDDIKQYFRKIKPDFIINAAIASIDSDPLLSYETNYLGTVNLAMAAVALKIPYIHLSSAATMPNGLNLKEGDSLPLHPEMTNYAKSKLMAETTLQHMSDTMGLDCTLIRLAVVYGKHDHKIQGFHRLFFSIADQAVPVMMTKRGVRHSYSNTKKLPPFLHYILYRRNEFSGKCYNFVDPEPVELARLILTIKSYLQLKTPKEIYIPYPMAKMSRNLLKWIMKRLNSFGIEARMAPELIFLENFYQTQTLSADNLAKSSYGLPQPEVTVYSELPDMIEYYLTRWQHLNLVSMNGEEFYDPKRRAEEFMKDPIQLLETVHQGKVDGLSKVADFLGE